MKQKNLTGYVCSEVNKLHFVRRKMCERFITAKSRIGSFLRVMADACRIIHIFLLQSFMRSDT